MKKFVIKSFVFVFIFALYFVLINIIYIVIIENTDYNFKKRFESLKFNNPDFKLLVLGASTSLDGIETGFLTSNGIKSYNLAIDGSTVRTNYIQLNEYLTQYSKRPKYVVLGLNSSLEKSFDDDGIHPIVEVTMKNHNYIVNDVPILKFKWLGFEFLKKIVSKKHRNAKISYGQVKFQKAVSDNTNFVESYLDIRKFESSHWIREIAKLCNQNGIELIILEMPAFKETQNLNEIGPHKLYFKNGYSAILYNFNSRNFCEIFDSDKDWIGNSHLNESGAKTFTKELISILNK
jgi:hypothetical protein